MNDSNLKETCVTEYLNHDKSDSAPRLTTAGSSVAQRNLPILAIAVPGATALVLTFFVEQPQVRLGLLAFGAATVVFAFFFTMLKYMRARKFAYATQVLVSLVENDASPCFFSDIEGKVSFRNQAASDRFPDRTSDNIGRILSELFANPSAVLFRFQSKAQALGSAREDIVTRKGHVRLSLNFVDNEQFLWRVEDLADRGGGARAADALSLPMLTAGPTGTVLYMNEAFRRLLGGRAKNLEGVFSDLPIVSGQIHKVLCEAGEIDSLVAEVPSHGGRREIYLLPGDSLAENPAVAADWDAIEELPVPLLKIATSGDVIAANHEARV
ncbi:MAG: hybrid sensor histidine kinase/response regulator, partial [Octadecabacter sp.]